MGKVYLAKDTRLGRTVAIKVLEREKVADAERKRRFMQEARAASALNHPNIVTLYDIASDSGIDFLVMEYVEGQSLHNRISPRGCHSRKRSRTPRRSSARLRPRMRRASCIGISSPRM